MKMRDRPKKQRLSGGVVLVFCAIAGAIFGLSGLGKVAEVPPPVGAAELHQAANMLGDVAQSAGESSVKATLVFSEHIQTLAPAFAPEMIIKSDPLLPSDHVYKFNESENATVDYEMQPKNVSQPQSIAAACLNADEIENYAGHLQRALALPVSAEPVIAFKLMTSIPENMERTLIAFADPNEIASRLPWQSDGNPVEIARVHFVIGESNCGETDYALPPPEIREAFRNLKAAGYEIGVWK